MTKAPTNLLRVCVVLVGFASATPARAAVFAIQALETTVTAPNGSRLYVRIVQPSTDLYPGRRFPALIAIPGGTGSGAPLADIPEYRNLAAAGFVFACFNPEGRGNDLPGNLRSAGAEDCNGFHHQDDLKAVIEAVAARPNVDSTDIGVETSSLGIAIGAGALGRYPDLPVRYLVDREGPHDNRVITFYDAGHETAVCGHLSTVTDPSPENVAFWAEREAVRHIGGFRGHYLRMQAEIDHAQNPGYVRHAIEIIDAATASVFGGTGSATWTRLNGSDVGNPIDHVYSLGDPGRSPRWLSGRLADHPGLGIVYDKELAASATFLLAGDKLKITDKRTADKRNVAVCSRDVSIASPAPDATNAPTRAGGILEIINPESGEAGAFPLPAAYWKGMGTPAGSRGYRYRDPRREAGPCRSVRIVNGKRLDARCRGSQITFTLDEPSQGTLLIRLGLGAGDQYCLAFGGTAVVDAAGTFEASSGAAPTSCAVVR